MKKKTKPHLYFRICKKCGNRYFTIYKKSDVCADCDERYENNIKGKFHTKEEGLKIIERRLRKNEEKTIEN